jgi:hypothetical protein
MKTVNLIRAFVTPAAKGRRFADRGFKGAFLGNPDKKHLLAAIVDRAEDLKVRLDKLRADEEDDLYEAEIGEIKQQIENLAIVLEIVNAWHSAAGHVSVDHPMAVIVAGVQIGVIKFESEPVFDVRS